MPRLVWQEETGWWSLPLDGEAAPVIWIGETWRGPDNPPGPPWLPDELRERELAEPDAPPPDEPPLDFEDAGPQADEDLRWQWYEEAEAAERGEVEFLDVGGFEFAAYQAGQACTVPSQHPPPGTIIGTPGSGTHSWTDPPNNWQSDNAVDIWLFPGTVVRACAAGRVSTSYGFGGSESGASRFGGKRLHVEHDFGMISFYQHLERITVRRGAHVRRGQAIGRSGFGNCVPHLHFAVTQPRDPRAYAALTYQRGAPPNPPPPAGEPVEPPPRLPRRGPSQSWHNLMVAIGPDRRRQRNRLRKARRAAKKALE